MGTFASFGVPMNSDSQLVIEADAYLLMPIRYVLFLFHKVRCQKFLFRHYCAQNAHTNLHNHQQEIAIPDAIETIAFNDVFATQLVVATWHHSDSKSLLMITSLMFRTAIAKWRLVWVFTICLSFLYFW
jgi:hypothetical protein